MKNRKVFMIHVLLFILVVAIAGSTAYSEPDPAKNTIIIQDASFQPDEITIQKGETIIWINKDSAGHTVRGSFFYSGLLREGQSFQQTFNEAGTFDYYCTLHPSMNGRVIVQ
ncbi:MAG: Copper-binding protein [Firmicutes bacterium]|nr:Copper-binding protein [Bacillota bacterium]